MDQEELGVKVGPGGVEGTFKGSQTIHVLLTLLLGAWIAFLFYIHDGRAAEWQKADLAEKAKLVAIVEKQEKTMRTMIYVLTLPQTQREKLRLAEPEQLRELQRYDR